MLSLCAKIFRIKKSQNLTQTVNTTNATLLGSASGSTQVHTNRQTKLGAEGGREGLEGARRRGEAGGNARNKVRFQGVGGGTGWVCD